VQVAVRDGRLERSVVLDAQGNRKISDAALADQEWEANTSHDLVPLSGPGRPAGDATGRSALSQARRAEKLWRARLATLEHRRKAAALVEASEVEPAIAKEFARCRDRLLRISADWARRCPGLSPAAVAAADALVREALEGLDDVIERGGKL
jgi:hypothetical protein